MACTKKQDTSTQTQAGGESSVSYYGTTKPKHGPDEIWVNNREEPQHLDPTLATGVPDGILAMNAFARLVQIDPQTSKPIADLAQSWESMKEGTQFVFTMREGLTWSDGHPLTAHDFEYSWKRLMDPKTGARYAGLAYTAIDGGEAFARGAVALKGWKQKPDVTAVESYLQAQQMAYEKVTQSAHHDVVFVFFANENRAAQQKDFIKAIAANPINGQTLTPSIANADTVGVKALDAQKLQVQLVGPLPFFVTLAEFSCFAAVPKHVIEKVAKAHNGDETRWTSVDNMVCSGAYCLAEENFKVNKIYKKNPRYWDAASVKTPKIVVKMIEKETAVMNAYKVGELDVFGPHQVPSEMVASVSKFDDYHDDPYLGIYYYIVNTKVQPLDDPRVREALALAIDRKKLTDYVLGGSYKPYHGFVPDGLAGYESRQKELFNPEKARKLLAEAGYPNGEGMPVLKFKYDTKEIHRLVAQAVQQMWKENLNVQFEMVNVEWKIYLDDLNSHNFELTRWGWIGDFLDPFTFHELMLSTSGNNHTNWSSLEYDRLVNTANRQADAQKRLDMLAEAEQIVMDAQAVIPMFLYTKTYMHKPYVKGFYADYQDHHLWKHMYIETNEQQKK